MSMRDPLLAIVVLHWLVLLTPGPNVLLVSTLAAAGHRRAALMAAIGVTVVAVGWALLAVAGVDALLRAHAGLRAGLQAAGAAYLLALALRLWRSRGGGPAAAPGTRGGWAAFRLGVVTNLGNPKSALFFGSVFATALPAAPSPGLLGAALLAVLVNALGWHVLLALLFSRPGVQAVYQRHARALGRVAAGVLAVFGARLLVDAWRAWRGA